MDYFPAKLTPPMNSSPLTSPYLVRLIKTTASSPSPSLPHAVQLHALISKTPHLSSDYICSALISLYSTLDLLPTARKLFDEIPHPALVSYTSIIRAYTTKNHHSEALLIFRKMRYSGLAPDVIALTVAMSACRNFADSGSLKTIHGYIAKSGILLDAFASTEMIKGYGDHGELKLARCVFDEMAERTPVAWNALIYAYAKHEQLDVACLLFQQMPTRDVVSWNTMISALSQAGRCRDALALFHEMESSSVKPSKLTMSIVLSACAALGALETALWFHAYIERKAINADRSLDHCLIDMYAKCGSIEKAVQVFDKVPVRRDLYSWTSMICGFAMHGQAERAIFFFLRMQDVGVQPDGVTLVGILSACAHAGLVDQGCQIFGSMEVMHGVAPKIEHYGCVVDLLCRVGRLSEAYDLVLKMPMKPNAVVWGTLLSACKVHSDVEIGGIVAAKLIELDPFDPWARVMLSSMYAKANDWSGFIRLRKEMRGVGTRKMPGCSSIEVNGVVHEFLAGGSLHQQHSEIQAMVENIEEQMQMGWNGNLS